MRNRILSFLLILDVGLFASISCTPARNVGNGNGTPAVLTSRHQAIAANASGSIHDLDFKNFTYPWYPSYLMSPYGARQVTLKDGKFEINQDAKKGVWYLLIELDDVSFADLRNSGNEAIVYLRGISVINRFVGCVFIYAQEEGKPKLLWQYETGDRADGGLRRISVEDHRLVVEQNILEDAGGVCCPKKFARRYFKWDGREFRSLKTEVFAITENKS